MKYILCIFRTILLLVYIGYFLCYHSIEGIQEEDIRTLFTRYWITYVSDHFSYKIEILFTWLCMNPIQLCFASAGGMKMDLVQFVPFYFMGKQCDPKQCDPIQALPDLSLIIGGLERK